jgi:chaperone required for assembly of F1-ATPase
MRNIFGDMFRDEPADPMEAARRAMRPVLRKRFFQAVKVGEFGDQYRVLVDERPVRTPAGNVLAAPRRELAEAIAAEWQAQTEVIEPTKMPLTRLSNTIIDGVATAQPDVTAEIVKYLGSDLVLYRASEPERLVARQEQQWDPVLAWARDALGARFKVVRGIMFVEQPLEAIAAASAAIPQHPWRLGAVHVITTLTGSALIALALANDRLSLEAAWTAAHLDEDWNMELWGRDELALARRGVHLSELQAAATVLGFVR